MQERQKTIGSQHCLHQSHADTHTHTENTFHPPYPKQPIALAGICDPNPYFNFPPLMKTNSILVAFPHKRSAMWEMSFFSCCIYKRPNQRHFWVGSCLCQLCLSRPAHRQTLGCDTWRWKSGLCDNHATLHCEVKTRFSSHLTNREKHSSHIKTVFKTHVLSYTSVPRSKASLLNQVQVTLSYFWPHHSV